MPSLTSANAVLMLAVSGLYAVPQQIQGFSSDDVTEFADIATKETSMGVDGNFSAGFVFTPIQQTITLQADSASNTFFEAINAAEQAAKEAYPMTGVLLLKSVGKSYALTRGFLTSYSTVAGAKKILQPRKYVITWGSVVAVPV